MMLLIRNIEILIKLFLMYKLEANSPTSRKTGESKTSRIGGSWWFDFCRKARRDSCSTMIEPRQ